MDYIKLGTTGLDVSPIAIGATTLTLRLSTHWGSRRQQDQYVTLRLKDDAETVLVGEFEVASLSRIALITAMVGEEGDARRADEAERIGVERAKKAGVESVVFDRAGNKYHGRVAALAEGAREAGLDF